MTGVRVSGAAPDRISTVARWLLVAAVIVVLAVLLWPSRPAGDAQSALELWFTRAHAAGLPEWISFPLVEFCANILMFLPIGLLGALSRLPGGNPTVLTACLVLSCGAELVQGMTLPDRTGDPRDVVANTLGAVIGMLIAVLARRRIRGASPLPHPANRES